MGNSTRNFSPLMYPISVLRALLIAPLIMLGALVSAQGTPDWLWITRHATDVVTHCAWHPDGQRFYTSGWDSLLKEHDASTGKVTRQIVIGGMGGPMAVSPDGEKLVVAGSRIRIYRMSDLALLFVHPNAGGTNVTISKDGTLLLVSQSNCFIRVYNLEPLTFLYSLKPVAYNSHIGRLAITDDNRYIAADANYDGVFLFDLQTRQELPSIPYVGYHGGAVAFSPDGQKLAIAPGSSPIRLYDMPSVTYTGSVGPTSSRAFMNFLSNDVLLSGDGALLRKLHVPSSVVLNEQTLPWGVSAGATSADGELVLSVGSRGMVRTHDIDTLALRDTYEEHTRAVLATDFIGDHVINASQDHSIRIWDTYTATERLAVSALGGPVYAVRVAKDRSFIAVGAGQGVRLLHPDTGSILHTFPHVYPVHMVALSPDGRLLALSNNSSIYIYDLSTKQQLYTYFVGESGKRGEFTTDSRYFISLGTNVTVRDMLDGSLVREFSGGGNDIAVSQTNTHFAVVHGTSTKMFDYLSGELVRDFTTRSTWGRCAISSDGSTLVVAGDVYHPLGSYELHGFVELFDIPTGALICELRGIVSASDIVFSDDDSLISIAGPAYGVFRNPLIHRVSPTSFLVKRGKLVGGNTASLHEPGDNDELKVAFDGRTRGNLRCEVEVLGALSTANLRQLEMNMRVRLAANSSSTITVQLFDYAANTWSTTDTWSSPISAAHLDVKVKASGDVNRYVSSTGQVRMRYQVTSVASVMVKPGACWTDWVEWTAKQ